MAMKSSSIYQSGQKVPLTGIYQVVGIPPATRQKRRNATRTLRMGDLFPAYEGWEVCWRLAADDVGQSFEKATSHEGAGVQAGAKLLG